jgi:diadenosine tetraphosphate (Ap4A) HIT family hydrolase
LIFVSCISIILIYFKKFKMKTPSIDAGDLSPEFAAGFFKELPLLISIVKKASGAPAVKVLGNCGGLN